MKKLLCLVFVLAMVCSLLFAFNVSADEGTLKNVAGESTITTNAGADTWWIHQNKDNLKDGDPTTGMHSSNKEGTTVVTFTLPAEKRITKIVMLVNGTATTSAVSPTDMNAATDYKVTVGGYTETKNALDQRELVFNLDQTTNTVTIEFKSNWGWSNALIREVEIYEYIPPVEEVFNGKNIEDEATIQTVDGNSYIVGGSNYLIDNDPFTGLSAGNAASWINYHFLYEEGRNINRVVVVVNSTGTMYKVGSADGTYVHETMSTLPNIYLRLYDASNAVKYKLENVSTSKAVDVEFNGKTYKAYTFDLGGEVYTDIVKVEVATVHNKDTKLGVWEVEIFEHQCELDGHKFATATCAAPETCIYCGTTQGEASAEHTGTWSVATCTTLSTCSACGATTGELDADNHTWKDATCNAPKTCVDCSVTEGEPTGEHNWVDVSCAAPKHCSGCGETEGEALPHANILKDGNCATDDKCRVCKQVVVAAIAHNLDANGYCTNDGCYYRNIEKNVASSATVTSSGDWWAVSVGKLNDGNWDSGTHAPKSSSFSYVFDYGTEMNFSRFVVVANGLCNTPGAGDVTDYAIMGVKVTLKDANGNKVYETTAYAFDTNDIEIVLPYPMTAVSATFAFTSTAQYGSSFVREIEIYEPKIDGCGVHNFGIVAGGEATCTVDGFYSVVCSVCQAVESVHVTPATGHKIGTDYVVINRTCTSAPVLQFACSVCGETEERAIQVNDIIDRADKTSITSIHSGGGTTAATMFDGSLDTWTQASAQWAVIGTINFDRAYYLSSVTVWIEGSSVGAGLIVYYQAPGSDEWIQAGDAMIVHAPWGEIGKFTYEIKEEIYASAIKVYVGDKDGTPQGGGPGLESFNGRLYEVAVAGSLEKEIAAGHTWVAGEAVAAGCADYGYTPYTCSVCGETMKSDFVKATGHKWVNATCVAPKTCSVCELTNGEALEHNFVASEPDENGAVTYSCDKGCNDSYVINNSALNGTYYADAMTTFVFENGVVTAMGESYNYTYNVTTGVLTVEGLPDGMLSVVEGEIFFRGRVKLHQHNEDEFIVETTDATCTADGLTVYICQFCGPLSEEVIKATGHSWLEDYSNYYPATCVSTGYVGYYCENCEETYTEETPVDETNHWVDYSKEYESESATCVSEGYFTYYCMNCEKQITEVEEIDTDWGHDWETVESVDLTCQNAGYTKLECSLCGAVEEYTSEMDPDYPAHVWDDGVAIAGGFHYECTLCDAAKDEITLGTDMDPIEAVLGDNEVVYYVINEELVVYYAIYVDAGTVTLNVAETAGVKMGYSPYMMYWENYMTGSTSYTFEMESAGRLLICISLDEEAYTIPETFSLEFAAKVYPEIEIGDNEITVGDWENFECVVTVPGKYILSVSDNTSIIIPDEYGFSMIMEYPYEFTVAEGETVRFMVTTADHTAGTVVVTLLEKVDHVHTEVEIPAVLPLPSNGHIGWSAGVMCSECEAILVAPVEMVAGTSKDPNFKINSATLSLGEDIGVTYNATIPAGSNVDSMYMVFVFDGKEFVVETSGLTSGYTNRYRFVFKGMRANLMAANIEAYVYAIEDGNYVMKSHLQYSVKQYCVNQLKKTIADNFKALIFSVLNLGDCTQLAVDSTTPAEALISNIVANETGLTVPGVAVETIDPSYNVQAISGDRKQGYDWKSGGIALGSSVQLKLQFVATDVEGLVLKFDVAGQRTIEVDASELTLGADGRYTVYFQVKVLEYDDTITCTFEKNGEQIGSTLTYSVYTYLVRQYANTANPVADRNFMKALYEYAEAVKAMN